MALGDSDLFPSKSEEKREMCAVHPFQCIQFQLCIFVFTCLDTNNEKTLTLAKPSMRRHSETIVLVGNPTGSKPGVRKELTIMDVGAGPELDESGHCLMAVSRCGPRRLRSVGTRV